jgi:hypothetical protein
MSKERTDLGFVVPPEILTIDTEEKSVKAKVGLLI